MQDRLIIQNRFRLDGRLNQGAFGVIYKGTDLTTGKKVAIKFESVFSPQPQLAYEYKLYKFFATNVSDEDTVGIPKVYWFGVESSFYCLVLDLLGFSLEDLFSICNRRFTLKTTLMLIDQMLARIETIHSHCYLHRDVKPDNYVIGLGEKQHEVHIIDLGLAKRYRDPVTKTHVPYSEQCQLTGTIRYLSKAAHLGIESSRRDDLESLGYIWIYFLKGSLPWQGLKANNDKQRQEAIFQLKIQTTIQELCYKLPVEFQVFFEYVKSLGFYDKPDYSFLRNLFRNLMAKFNYKYDNIFDWTPVLADTNLTLVPPTSLLDGTNPSLAVLVGDNNTTPTNDEGDQAATTTTTTVTTVTGETTTTANTSTDDSTAQSLTPHNHPNHHDHNSISTTSSAVSDGTM